MNKHFQKRDLYLNLLPREYLPEPEFKLFPIVAIILIGVLGFWLYTMWNTDKQELDAVKARNQQEAKKNRENIAKVIAVPVIQANSRYILSYIRLLPGLIDLGPDWLNVYIEMENNLPVGLWFDRMSFVGGSEKGIWPGIKISGVSSSPQAVEKVLNLAEDLEESNQFITVNLRGWQWIDLPEGGSGVAFQMDMGIER